MKVAKCTSCGANIEVDENKEAGVCPFCNTAFITEKAIKNYSTNTTNNAGTIINNYYSYPEQINTVKKANIIEIPPRPKVNVFLAILGIWFYIIPGLIYIGNVRKKQDEWDEKYNKEN